MTIYKVFSPFVMDERTDYEYCFDKFSYKVGKSTASGFARVAVFVTKGLIPDSALVIDNLAKLAFYSISKNHEKSLETKAALEQHRVSWFNDLYNISRGIIEMVPVIGNWMCFRYDRIVGNDVILVAREGRLDRLQVLLNDRTIRVSALQRAAVGSANEGHLGCLQFLLNCHRAVLENYPLGQTVQLAAQNGHLGCLQFLLSDNRTISEEDLGLAVRVAAQNGYPECLQFLLSDNRTISESNLGLAVIVAAQNGDLGCLEALFSNDREISEADLAEAILCADEGHYLACSRFLSGEPIPRNIG